MKTWQAWVLGTAIIVTSIGSCTVQTFTGKATTETYVEAGQGVKKGVDVIRNGGEEANTEAETPKTE